MNEIFFFINNRKKKQPKLIKNVICVHNALITINSLTSLGIEDSSLIVQIMILG